MKKLMIFALIMTFVSCGKKSNKSISQLRGDSSSSQNPYSLLADIKQKYGITNDTDMVSVINTIKTDLRDSGVFINVEHPPQLRPVPAEGTDWNSRKTKRKIRRAYKWKLKNKGVPKGIVWKKVEDKCEDLTVSIDRVDDGSYDAQRVAPLIEQYMTLSNAYLIENNLNELNCLEYKEIDQAQVEMRRIFMNSVSSASVLNPDGSTRNISGLNPGINNGNRRVLPKN